MENALTNSFSTDVKIIQTRIFSYSIDSVLLSDFQNSQEGVNRRPLCSGNGARWLLFAKYTYWGSIILQERLAGHGQIISVTLNSTRGPGDKPSMTTWKFALTMLHDLRWTYLSCNPPYFKTETSKNVRALPLGPSRNHDYLEEICQVARHAPQIYVDFIALCIARPLILSILCASIT